MNVIMSGRRERSIIRQLRRQPATVREAVIECIDPAYKKVVTRLLFPTRGMEKFAFPVADLQAVRARTGPCRTCGGFIELRHDDMQRAVGTCVPCGRPAEVT